MEIEQLRNNRMIAHLLDALDRGEDIGHYGRLVFARVGRHFLSDVELVAWIQKNPGVTSTSARP